MEKFKSKKTNLKKEIFILFIIPIMFDISLLDIFWTIFVTCSIFSLSKEPNTPINFLFNSLFKTDYDPPYFILIGIGALMAVMSVLISWNINTEPFDYYSESEETTTKEDDNVIVSLAQKEKIIE